MKITLRRVQESDEAFLLRLYASTRQAELALTPWNEAQKQAFVQMQFLAQRQHYASAFPAASYDIICCDGNATGRLYVDRQPRAIHVLDIIVDAEKRKRGIGTFVLEEILREADQAQKRVTIYVEEFSPARRVFDRRLFREASKSGFQILLTREPQKTEITPGVQA